MNVHICRLYDIYVYFSYIYAEFIPICLIFGVFAEEMSIFEYLLKRSRLVSYHKYTIFIIFKGVIKL